MKQIKRTKKSLGKLMLFRIESRTGRASAKIVFETRISGIITFNVQLVKNIHVILI